MSARRRLTVRLASQAASAQTGVVNGLTDGVQRSLLLDWIGWAEPGQVPPPGDWRVWLLRGGRGFGKTRSGAEWVTMLARDNPALKIALVAATLSDARRVMVEGESGLLGVAGLAEPVTWHRSTGEFAFASGARAYVYSADRPDSLRGPQHHVAWCDELAKWRYGEAAWDNLWMGLRLGDRPQVVVTTTPRPVPLMRKIMALPGCVQTRGATRDNRYLPETFLASVEAEYAGTRLGRQELEGEMLEDHEGSLWTRAMLDACRVETVPTVRRVVVAVDPPASAGGDACGIVAAALGEDGVGYVLEDASVVRASPAGWAAAVAACAQRHGADRVVAEKNQGGDMVGEVLRGADTALPVRLVHASRGKLARAEPVAALYEQGRVRHVGRLAALEEELAGMVVGGVYAGPGRSPDRADALVWAITELMLRERPGKAMVRAI